MFLHMLLSIKQQMVMIYQPYKTQPMCQIQVIGNGYGKFALTLDGSKLQIKFNQ